MSEMSETPVIDSRKGQGGPPEWVAFNWRTVRPSNRPRLEFVRRPSAGRRFRVRGGTWAGDWIVRAHDAVNDDIFFAERAPAAK